MSREMTVSFPGGKRVVAAYGGFEILTDQAVDSGGEASAPEPYDLFLASLATCAGFYVLSFCSRRGIPLDGIGLVQRWSRSEAGKMIRIDLEVRVPEEFPEKYRAPLARAAGQCSVKRTIDSPPAFEVSVRSDGVTE